MNIRDLQYLVALIDHKHFGKAADACFVSQPALSMQIKKLEKYLDVQLLERTNKSVMLTKIGESLGERARQILTQVDELRDLAKQAKDPFSGEFKLGIFPTLAPYLLPRITPKVSKKFPALSLFLIEEKTDELLDKLKNGYLDAALLALPINEIGLTTTPLFEEEFMLAVPREHEFANRKTIKQSDLKDKALLLLEQGHCLRDQALSLCHRVKAQESENFKATSLETLRHMVASGIGITLIPQLACKTNDGISYIAFQSPKPIRTIGMVWRSSTSKSLLMSELVSQIKNILVKQQILGICGI